MAPTLGPTRNPLICTVSVKFTSTSELPKDGLCDIIFYESFYIKNKPTGWTDPGLDHFLELATKLRATSVGASFSPNKDKLFADALSGSLNAAVDRLRSLGVSHFGTLSLYGKYTMPAKLLQCLKLLQWFPVMKCGLMKLCSAITEPSFFVALTHVPFADRKRRDCRILPMTMLDFPAVPPRRQMKYAISIKEALRNLQWTQSHKWDFTWMAISFSMRGHMYAPANISGDDSAYKLFRPCKNFTAPRHDFDVQPTSRCPSSHGEWTYRFESDVVGEYTYDTARGLMMVFDSEISIRKKICEAKAAYPAVPFGVAAYDVDYDSVASDCPSMQIGFGAYRRVKALRRLNEFMEKRFTDASRLQECLVLALL
ncbi:hypothetical protein HPB52_008742 [Rhipicephalus sanguineus]|uniref:Uncharacterized protein n=1 Tax=Rhipicephalus sanguineus TaxID=34632 RepID=A0A9D4PIL7_RHISA|nr:hypothetical protein HPB52_008742 [Rhipicephalus sanguineus]